MSAFLYGIRIQWMMDLRNKGILITYYIVPLVFFAFMGVIFTSIDPNAKNTLIQSMTIFGVSMGAFLGAPAPLVELYGSDIKKSYKAGGIPLWIGMVNNLISAFLHLLLMSTIIYLVAPIAFEASTPESTPFYFLSLCIFLLVCLLIGSLIGLCVKNASKLTMISQFLFLPSIMLSGIMFPTAMLPKAIANAGFIFPAAWGMKMMTGAEPEMNQLIPLVIIGICAVLLCVFQLRKINKV